MIDIADDAYAWYIIIVMKTKVHIAVIPIISLWAKYYFVLGKTYFMTNTGRLCSLTNSEKIESKEECKAAMGQIRKFDSRLTWIGEASGTSRGCSITDAYAKGYKKIYWNPTDDSVRDSNSHTICISECTSA